jgi:purine-binding chemotaxis protein CheW
MNRTETAEGGLDLLVFELGELRLALELTVVREVALAVAITPLPEAPAVVEGIIDVRGEVVPVYDVRRRFGLPASPLHPDQRLVIAWTGERLVALRCDSTGRIESVAAADMDTSSPLRSVQGRRRIAGVARLPDGLALIQDLARFLEDAEHAALEDALSAHASAERG